MRFFNFGVKNAKIWCVVHPIDFWKVNPSNTMIISEFKLQVLNLTHAQDLS